MLRANATQGIKLPQGDSTRPVEAVLKQWRIAKSLIRGGKKVKLFESNDFKNVKNTIINDNPRSLQTLRAQMSDM